MSDYIINTNGTVTISIEYFDQLRNVFKEQKKQFEEDKTKFENKLIKTTTQYYSHSDRTWVDITWETPNDTVDRLLKIEKEKQAQREKDIISSTKYSVYHELRNMNIFQFRKWKKYPSWLNKEREGQKRNRRALWDLLQENNSKEICETTYEL